MSDLDDKPADDAEEPRELSEDELDDVTGGSCVDMTPAQLNP